MRTDEAPHDAGRPDAGPSRPGAVPVGAELLRAVRPRVSLGGLRQVRPREMLVRFALGAAVSVVAGIISQLAGSRLGGVFLAFPAILPASLTILQEKDGTRDADRDAIGAVLGGLGLVVFAAVAESLFVRDNPVVVLAAALAAWVVAVLVFYAGLAVVRPDDCDVRRD